MNTEKKPSVAEKVWRREPVMVLVTLLTCLLTGLLIFRPDGAQWIAPVLTMLAGALARSRVTPV